MKHPDCEVDRPELVELNQNILDTPSHRAKTQQQQNMGKDATYE